MESPLELAMKLYHLALPSRRMRDDRAAERRAQSITKAGRALPLPPPPKDTPAIQRSRVAQSERYAEELRQVQANWDKQPIPTDDVTCRPPDFDQAVSEVRGVTGDWSQLAGPLQTFGRMPAPWRWVGAAEVMRPLAYVRNDVFVPTALRQGLRFVVEAQNADQQNVDALLIRAMLLSCTSDTGWVEMAQQTLAIAQSLAPNHPRLPLAETAYYRRTGQTDRALEALGRAAEWASTPEDAYTARTTRAHVLLNANRLDEAATAYEALTRENDRNPWVWQNYSLVLRRLSRFEEALDANERALAIMEFPAARESNTWLRNRLGKPIAHQ